VRGGSDDQRHLDRAAHPDCRTAAGAVPALGPLARGGRGRRPGLPPAGLPLPSELLVFIQQPEYWGIEVVGSLPEIGLPALAPYEVSLAITPFLGAKGIEVIGASRVQRFDIQRSGGEA
jgi:hypothetical protein